MLLSVLVHSVVFAVGMWLGTPGDDVVQRYSWLVHALPFRVLAACWLLCGCGIVS